MKILVKAFISTTIISIFCASNMHADCVKNPPDFMHLSFEQAGRAVRQEEHKTVCDLYVTNLVEQFQSKFITRDNQTLIIYLLGRLRVTNLYGIQFLVENIAFKAERIDPGLRLIRWGFYPADEALCNIGMPAVPSILRALPTETSHLPERLLCDVLVIVEGHAPNGNFSETKGKRIARAKIQELLRQESDPIRRNALNAELVEVDKWKIPGLPRYSISR